MKIRLTVLLLAFACLLSACKKQDGGSTQKKEKLAPLAGTYTVDSNASQVSFTTVKNHELSVSGKFKNISGSIEVPKDDTPDKSTGTIIIDVASLNTGSQERDQNILEHFFEAVGDNVVSENITFTLGPMKAKGTVESPLEINKPVELIANGELKIHKTTKSQQFRLTVTRVGPNRILITNSDPYVFDINKFKMADPLKKLMEVCDHGAVSNIVPVQLHIVLTKSS